jgi:hypothetical protein
MKSEGERSNEHGTKVKISKLRKPGTADDPPRFSLRDTVAKTINT